MSTARRDRLRWYERPLCWLTGNLPTRIVEQRLARMYEQEREIARLLQLQRVGTISLVEYESRLYALCFPAER